VKRLALGIAGLVTLLCASPAAATTTIGQLQPPGGTPDTCGPSSGAEAQPTVTSGTPYVVPANGVRITSWSTRANSTSNGQLALRIFRPLGASSYLAVAHDGLRTLTPSLINTFPVSIAVQPGDILGDDSSSTANFPVACLFEVPGETYWTSFPNPSPDDGSSGIFSSGSNQRVNVTAEVEVTNAFSFGAVSRNKKKGKASAVVHATGPGSFALAGKGLKAQQATLGNTVGDVSLSVIATGKVKKKLRSKGKARVSVSVSYTPDGGSANTQTETVKLVKKS
jgi:hypothetical protein